MGKRKGRRIKAQFDEGGVEAVARANKRGVGGAGPESVNDAPLLWARALGGCEGAKPKNWRVIVRNLAFRATDAEIREACSEAGFVWDLTVPRDFHGKPKGFAFAAYCRKAHAEAAVKKVNGKTIAGRPVAVDLALSKRSYEEAKKEAANEKEGEEEEGGEEEDENGSEEESSSGSGRRVLLGVGGVLLGIGRVLLGVGGALLGVGRRPGGALGRSALRKGRGRGRHGAEDHDARDG